YNPFNYHTDRLTPEDSDFEKTSVSRSFQEKKVPANWDILFDGLKEKEEPVQTFIPEMSEAVNPVIPSTACYFQLKGRYIVTPVQSGVMLIDKKRAHERILYEKYKEESDAHKITGQKNLFPEIWELSASDFLLVGELIPDLEYLGFELAPFGKSCYAIHATPPDLSGSRIKQILTELIDYYKNTEGNIKDKMQERIVLSLAKAAAVGYNTTLTCEEMSEMTERLFACKHQNFTADGKIIIHILKYEDVNNWFK
ncbi:MAG: DNA mismatch repair protein MutL, partial [Odoribacter sp.]|nr:DNA mismatch repair protein MutL [Odoribacter sp.]